MTKLFVQVAKIGDSVDFVAAATSMGWDKTNYQEVLYDLENEEGFIPNFDVTKSKSKLGNVSLVDGVVFGTIGSEEGNRWYSLDCQVYQDKDGKFWADEDEVMEI